MPSNLLSLRIQRVWIRTVMTQIFKSKIRQTWNQNIGINLTQFEHFETYFLDSIPQEHRKGNPLRSKAESSNMSLEPKRTCLQLVKIQHLILDYKIFQLRLEIKFNFHLSQKTTSLQTRPRQNVKYPSSTFEFKQPISYHFNNNSSC